MSTFPRVTDRSQHFQVLVLLHDHQEHSNGELAHLEPRIIQINRVLSDLRMRGYPIESRQDASEPSIWWYRWERAVESRVPASTACTDKPARRPHRVASSHEIADLGLFR
jgi:hypothetical protein